MSLEIEKLGIVVSDNALRDIIKNDKLFFKNGKFSRTEYEKFLLKSGQLHLSLKQILSSKKKEDSF